MESLLWNCLVLLSSPLRTSSYILVVSSPSDSDSVSNSVSMIRVGEIISLNVYSFEQCFFLLVLHLMAIELTFLCLFFHKWSWNCWVFCPSFWDTSRLYAHSESSSPSSAELVISLKSVWVPTEISDCLTWSFSTR